ncbi:unnamed protein product [Anisakis simplex]|uniref:X-ray repair cross-complementing protein 5 (inferred by orthology to a human protein) n=1 Tax=Anisakis simplex TaxID=6269 RepID=A0A0M3JUR7_ANISI|nr:unnamed protein product [Anisakis simplex]
MSNNEEDRVVRAKKVTKHESTIVLLDVGVNMTRKGSSHQDDTDERSDFEKAKEALDWILTRKIFAKSPDEFTIILFGSDKTRLCTNCANEDGTTNIFFCEDEMQTAKMDWLKLIDKELKTSDSVKGDFVSALIVAIDYMRLCMEQAKEGEMTARNILLLSNLMGLDDASDSDNADKEAIINSIRALDINFNVIGPSICSDGGPSRDNNVKMEESEHEAMDVGDMKSDVAESLMEDIANKVDGVIYSFSEALPMLQNFVPRRVNIRAQRFFLELSEDMKLPLQLYKKNQAPDMKMNFAKIDKATGVEVKRETVYERPIDSSSNNDAAASEANSEGTQGGVLRKEDVIKEECVALVRYVYNAASYPRIMALFPRTSKKGVDMFVAILLPFYEDFRGLEFPSLDTEANKPNADQLKSMEAFVDAMDLMQSYYDPESGQFVEDLRPRDVPNPKMQRVCEAIKHRALNPNEELPDFDSPIIEQRLQPKPSLLEAAE